jgi:hypothetical protein
MDPRSSVIAESNLLTKGVDNQLFDIYFYFYMLATNNLTVKERLYHHMQAIF